MTPYERVQLSRQRTAGVFPLPSVLDCIRYAITELAEYDDALLRQERQGDKRNNIKQMHDPRSELGQALYMLLSAMMQHNYEPDNDASFRTMTPQQVYFNAIQWTTETGRDALGIGSKPYAFQNMQHSVDAAYSAMLALALSHSWDVDTLVDDTCNRFEQKHARAREIA
jgi:hypothetical protein